MHRFATALLLAATAFVAAGCETSGGNGGPVAVRPQGIEGSWVGTDNVAVSSFSNGRFVSTAADTGEKLAEGSYVYTNPQTVSINFTSLIRGTQIRANCSLVAPTQLNCTSDTGAQFSLVRRGGIA